MGIYKNKRDGSWFYQFELDRQLYQKYGFASHDAASKAQRQQIKAIEDGKKPVGRELKALSFTQAAQVFYDEYAHNLSGEDNYRARLPIIVACPAMQKKLVDITKDDIKKLRDYLAKTVTTKRWVNGVVKEQPIKPLTINHYHAHVKAIFEWWIKEKDLNMVNPARKVDMAQVASERVRFLYPAEEKLLTPAIIRHPWLFPYYFMGLETGLREANLCGLKVQDIDLTLNSIFIHGSDAKNGESGYVPISERLLKDLRVWMQGKKQDESVLGGYTPNSVSNSFTEVVRGVGIKDFTFHCLRHTFAYYHLSRGESIYKVSKLLLHKDVRVTQKHYGHLATKDLQEVVDGGKGIITTPVQKSVLDEALSGGFATKR